MLYSIRLSLTAGLEALSGDEGSRFRFPIMAGKEKLWLLKAG